MCVSLSVITCNNNPAHLKLVGRRESEKGSKDGRKEERKTLIAIQWNFTDPD
jgi:hypothetical protein